ncbi:hypothetical protein GGF32_009105 [Allomyces javanicus]|nr:hypothetical protein GGF32_009105 [Allomyces javanicus]
MNNAPQPATLVDVEDLAHGASSSPATASAGDGEKKQLYPSVPFYGPCIVRNLKPGETKKWCTCDMSCPIDVYKRQKACTGPHTDKVKICSACGWTPGTVLIDL